MCIGREDSEIDKKRIKTEELPEGRYKLQVTFDRKRTTSGPNAHIVTVWDRSGMTSNEGDVLMGFCPSCPEQVVSRPIIEPGKPEPSAVFCDGCKTPFPLKEMVDYIWYRTTTRTLAERLGRIFDQLKGDCDIILKFHKADLRYDPRTEKDSDMRKRLAEARAGTYTPPFYPLHRIVTDMKSGAPASALFENFLKA